MKQRCGYFLIVFLVPLLMGMGSMTGNDTPDKIPVPEKKFNVTFIDQMDIVTTCTEASIDGKTFMEGRKGKGVYTIPFDAIASVTFLARENELKALVYLKNKDTDELILDSSGTAFGRTAHGTFQIDVMDIKKMIINN